MKMIFSLRTYVRSSPFRFLSRVKRSCIVERYKRDVRQFFMQSKKVAFSNSYTRGILIISFLSVCFPRLYCELNRQYVSVLVFAGVWISCAIRRNRTTLKWPIWWYALRGPLRRSAVWRTVWIIHLVVKRVEFRPSVWICVPAISPRSTTAISSKLVSVLV